MKIRAETGSIPTVRMSVLSTSSSGIRPDEVVDPGAELADFSIGKAALDGHGSHEFNQLTGEVGREGTRLRGAVFTVRKQIFEADFPHRAAVEYRSGNFPLWRVIPGYNGKLSG